MHTQHKILVLFGFFLLFFPWSLEGISAWPAINPALILTALMLGILNTLIALGFHRVLSPWFARKPWMLVLPAWVLASGPVWFWPPFAFPLFYFLSIWALGILMREITGRMLPEPSATSARLTGGLVTLTTLLRVTTHFPTAEAFIAAARAAITQPVLIFLVVAVTLGFMSQRQPWQFFVLPTARVCLSGFFLLCGAGLTLLLVIDAMKTDVEFRTRHRFQPPIPHYQLQPHLDRIDAFPEELQGQIALSGELVRFLHDRQQALNRNRLEAIFQGAPLPPTEMLRAMQVYGLLREDQLGFHIPSEAYTMDLTNVLMEEYLPWVDKFREQTALLREDFDPDLFQEAIRRRIIIRVAPRDPRFRLSANVRGPLSNGLLPRQILTLLDAQPDQHWSIRDYADQWNVSPLQQAAPELQELAARGFLISRPLHLRTFLALRPNLQRFPLKQYVSLGLAIAGLLALYPLWLLEKSCRFPLLLLGIPTAAAPFFSGLMGFESIHPGQDAALRFLVLPLWLLAIPWLAHRLQTAEEKPQTAA